MPSLSLRLRIVSALLRTAAWLWRRLLFRTVFIGITGSVGKTTAKNCLAASLVSCGPVSATIANQNDSNFGLPRSILRVRPWHRFAVIETGIETPGHLERGARVLAPDVALIVSVALSHTKSFRTLDEIAAEKSKLLRYLKPRGMVVLNNDDPFVSAMRVPPGAVTVRYGSTPDVDCAISGVAATWPDRLSFTVQAGRETQLVRTRFAGAHWTGSVAGAIATAHALGVSLPAATAAIAEVPPFVARLEPVEIDGATFLRDDYKGSVATFGVALNVLREARVQRRVLVCSDLADSVLRHQRRVAMIGASAAANADVAIFVGRHAALARKRALKAGMAASAAHSFPELEDAAAFLRRERRPGDLILLSGQVTDHLSRIFHAQTGPVSCWKTKCSIKHVCDACPELRGGADNV